MKYTFSLIILISFCLTVSCKQVNTKKEVIPVINKPEDLRKWILDETMKDYDRNTFGYDLRNLSGKEKRRSYYMMKSLKAWCSSVPNIRVE